MTYDCVQISLHEFFLFAVLFGSNERGLIAYIEVDFVEVPVGFEDDVHII